MSIKIEVPNTASLYQKAKDNAKLVRPFDPSRSGHGQITHILDTLSGGILDLELFLSEQTEMLVSPEIQNFIDSHQEIWHSYELRSTIYISPLQVRNETHGFYSVDRIEKIKTSLEDMGIPSEFEAYPAGTSLDLLPDEDNLVHIEFGFAGQKEAGDFFRANIKEAINAFERRAWFDRLFSNPDERSRNDKLTVTLMNRKELDGEGLGSNYLKDEDSFARNVLAYARSYQYLLTALYRERGIIEPLAPIRFQLAS